MALGSFYSFTDVYLSVRRLFRRRVLDDLLGFPFKSALLRRKLTPICRATLIQMGVTILIIVRRPGWCRGFALTFNKRFCLPPAQMIILSGYTQETSAFLKHL